LEESRTVRSAIRTAAGRGRLFDSVIDTVGDTPTIRINKLGVGGRTIYAKAEFFNPAASVKDRLALNIIEDGERSGALKPGQTVVEATSGNTGIGLAMVCAQKGYPLVVTMADSFSVERRKLMRMLGAKVVLTPRAVKGFGMYQKAIELAEANGWFLAHQFETNANADIHEATTAREILGDFAGKRLDVFVTGYGTGGTVVGVGRVLRREQPNVLIVLSEPANASLVSDGRPQARNPDGSPASSHPAWESHPIQGWTPDNVGDVIVENNDIFGGGVNVAARLEGIAEPGAVVISASAHDAAINRVEAEFRDLGELSLKNIARPVRAFQVNRPNVAAAGEDRIGALGRPERPSIAVRPFVVLADDRGLEFLATGLSEDVTALLARVPGFS
jgi:cysteine synthase A